MKPQAFLLVVVPLAAAAWLLARFTDPWLMAGYQRMDSAPRDGTVIEICLHHPRYDGWCDRFRWADATHGDVFAGDGQWVYEKQPEGSVLHSGLMRDDEPMADGLTSKDLLMWKPITGPHRKEVL